MTAGRDEATCRRPQGRHHVPVQLDQENQSAHHGPARATYSRARRRRHTHRFVPARSAARRSPLRSSCSNRADDTCRLLGNARMTTWSPSWRSVSMPRTAWRRRRDTRCRSTAEPTDLATINPTRGPSPASKSFPRRTCTTRSGCAVRIPCFTVASNSRDRLMRLRAGSTANKPVGQIRQISRGGPCGGGPTRWHARHGYASVNGSHAHGHGAGCSAGRSASPWPRRSPRSVSLEAFPAVRPFTFGSAKLLRDSVGKWSCCWPARSPGT